MKRRRATDARNRRLAERFGEALCKASSQTAEAIIDEALDGGASGPEIQSDIVGAAMRWVGELWELNSLTIADEHLATAISHQALIRLFAALQTAAPRSRERVLLAAVEGQHHVLGLRMVADVLEGAGFDVLYLGADVPTVSLAQMISEYRPAATGLSCTFPGRARVLIDAVITIADSAAQTRIFLGGEGVPNGLRNAGYPWQNTSIGIVKVVDELLAEPVQPLPPAIKVLRGASGPADSVRPDTEYDSLTDARMLGIVEDANEQSRRHARRAQDFRYLAFHDPVTGMPNRRAFDDRLAESNSQALEGALLMIDLDRFKDVNDGHGHDAGDELLRDIGHAIETGRRPGDFAARTGGDEFAVLLPQASLDAAVEVAERIRNNVKQANDYNVTASVGLAPLTGNPRADLLAADEALYAAKEAGRNRSTATTRGAPSPGSRGTTPAHE